MGSGFRNIAFGWIVTITLLTGCIPDPLEVHDIPQLQQKIVVSSQIISTDSTGQAVAVFLSKSIGALDASDDSDPQALLAQIMIADANVRIETGGESYPLTNAGNGLYATATMPLISEQSYTLFVDSPTAGSVTSTTVVKPLVRFDTVAVKTKITGRDTLADISYTFSDKAGRNWYMVNAQHITQEDLRDRILNPSVTTKMIDDVLFDGGSKSDDFRILFDEVEPGDTVAVMLSNISKEYFDFMTVREDTRFGLAAALGEPINYTTNVEGGLGFFNLYIPDVRIFTIED